MKIFRNYYVLLALFFNLLAFNSLSYAVTQGEMNAYAQELQRNAQFTTDAKPYIAFAEQAFAKGDYKTGCESAKVAYSFYRKIDLSLLSVDTKQSVMDALSAMKENQMLCRNKGYIR
jgi:hypothetical protein